MNSRVWAGCCLLALVGCDAGGAGVETSSSDADNMTSVASVTSGDMPSSGGIATSSPTSTGSPDGESSSESTSTGLSPVDPPPPCDGWRTELAEGFEADLLLELPGGDIAVAGSADGLARIEFFDSSGVPLWSFDHDPSGGGEGATEVVDITPVGADQLLGVVALPYPSPGFVFLLDLETQDVVWNHYMDAAYVDYPSSGRNSVFVEQGPDRVAATSQGELALISTAYNWSPLYLAMGLDPESGARTWLQTESAEWSQSIWFAANDVEGLFTLVSSHSAFGSSGVETHHWRTETGLPVSQGPGGSGVVSGDIAVRSDGALVLTMQEFFPGADTLRIVTKLPDVSPATTLEFQTEGFPSVVDTAVDGADRVYMLVSRTNASGQQRLIRFNPDVSVDTVYAPAEQTELRGVAVTTADDVIVLGRDRVDFIEELCLEV